MRTINKNRFILMATAALLLAIVIGFMISGQVSVSNTVNGRELPVYCVETPEKKIALTFDGPGGTRIRDRFWKF